MFPVECGLCSALSKNADERFQPHLFFLAGRDYKSCANRRLLLVSFLARAISKFP